MRCSDSATFRRLEEENEGIVKSGRTHLQDATPIKFSQEISGWRTSLEKDKKMIELALPELRELALGGTAVGTGLNAPKGFDLHGKTVGVIGTGKIGRIFAGICKGFGMRVLAYDKFPNPDSGLDYVELPELLRQADVISLHCPLTDETRHMIDADAIAQMKPGVVLVNTSRGGLVDTEALIEGLKSHKVGAACLDVYEEEGDLFYEDCSEEIVADDTLVRLISMPNVIVTSHQAFLTKEALSNIAATTVDNLLKFERGEPSPDTEVCYHCERKETCRKTRDQKCF